MPRIGQRMKCVNAKGMEHWITEGRVYTFAGFNYLGLYMISETGDVGYFDWRFVELPDDFSKFMEKVLKPVDLGKPVTA